MSAAMSLKQQRAMLPSRSRSVRVAAMAKSAVKAKAGPMVCTVCGYLYTDDFASAPGSYRCPVCAAPKKAFKAFKGNAGRSNDAKAMRKRRDELAAQLESDGESADEGADWLVPLGAASIALMGALYYFAMNR